MPLAAGAFVDTLLVLVGTVGDVAVAVPLQQVLVGPDQERPRAARRVHYPQPASPAARPRTLAFEELADGVLDYVVHDVCRRVVDPARLADLGLLLDHRLLGTLQPDHAPEELLVDLPENVHRQHRELVRAHGVVEAADDPGENSVVHAQIGRQVVGLLQPAAFAPEVKEAGVVAVVGLAEHLEHPPVDVVPVG